MSWLGSLAGVYDSLVEVGKINPGKVKGLMPPVIIEQNAHLEILIDEDSQFIKGEIVEKKQGSTFVPVTEVCRSNQCHLTPFLIASCIWLVILKTIQTRIS